MIMAIGVGCLWFCVHLKYTYIVYKYILIFPFKYHHIII